MLLSSRFYYINGGLTNQHIFKTSIIREFEQFLFLLELYTLRAQDEQTINLVNNLANTDSTRSKILDKVDNQLTDSLKLSYLDIENYLPRLLDGLNKLNNNNLFKDQYKLFRFTMDINEKINFKLILNRLYMNRLYNDLNAFYTNYLILEALFKLSINNIDVIKDTKKEEVIKEIPIPEIKVENNQLIIDEMLFIDNNLKQFIIHMGLNYYCYISKNHINIKDKLIELPMLFPNLYIVNDLDYYKSLVLSLCKCDINSVKLRIDKINKILLNADNIKSIEIMILVVLLYFYYIRLVYDSYSDYLLNNVLKLFIDCSSINNILNKYSKEDIKFNVYEISVDELLDIEIDNSIEIISEDYKHLLKINEDMFIDKVMNDKRILINKKRLIDINSFKFSNKNINKIMNYNFKDEYLSESYRLFNEYNKNVSIFLLKEKEVNSELRWLVLLFDSISKAIVKMNGNNLLDYYNILIDEIGENKLTHYQILFIIYQIIMPYMYLNNKIEVFLDCF